MFKAMIEQYFELNEEYCKGLDSSCGLFGLFLFATKEEILPPQYKSITTVQGYDRGYCYHLVNSENRSSLFFHVEGHPYSENDKGFFIDIDNNFDRITISYDKYNYYNDTEYYHVIGYLNDERYCGYLSFYEGIPSIVIPIRYKRLIFGNDIIAAIYDTLNHWYYINNGELLDINRRFDHIEGLKQGLNNPYPIIDGQVNLIANDNLYPFDDVSSCGDKTPYYIVRKGGKAGLWDERYLYKTKDEGVSKLGLVLDCLFDDIIPIYAYSPVNKHETDPACSFFTIEKDSKFGLYDCQEKKIIIPTLLNAPPCELTGVSYRKDYYSTIPRIDLYPIGFSCFLGGYGVVNRKGIVIIPFKYDMIHLRVFSDTVTQKNSTRYDTFFIEAIYGRYCDLYDEFGFRLFEGYFTSIQIIKYKRFFFICKDDHGLYKLYGDGWISGISQCKEVVKGFYRNILFNDNQGTFYLTSLKNEIIEYNPNNE